MSGKPVLPDDLQMNLKVILQRHVGKSNAITKEELSNKLFGRYNTTTDRQIREAVSLMQTGRNKDGHSIRPELIVTDTVTGGYYYVGNEEEFQAYMSDIQSRIDALVAKKHAMIDAYYKGKRGEVTPYQAGLF